jgi:hypothetical protein
MSDWLHNLPVPLMALAIFAFTYLLALAIFAAVAALATGGRAKSFKAAGAGHHLRSVRGFHRGAGLERQ